MLESTDAEYTDFALPKLPVDPVTGEPRFEEITEEQRNLYLGGAYEDHDAYWEAQHKLPLHKRERIWWMEEGLVYLAPAAVVLFLPWLALSGFGWPGLLAVPFAVWALRGVWRGIH